VTFPDCDVIGALPYVAGIGGICVPGRMLCGSGIIMDDSSEE
jgi:hypothetical protein